MRITPLLSGDQPFVSWHSIDMFSCSSTTNTPRGHEDGELMIKKVVLRFAQGFKDMSPPTKELMKLTLEQKLAHSGHPVLRWMMDNIYIRTDPAGNIKADKEKSTEKIDGAVATIMGLDRAIRCGNNTGASVYDDRGILFI